MKRNQAQYFLWSILLKREVFSNPLTTVLLHFHEHNDKELSRYQIIWINGWHTIQAMNKACVSRLQSPYQRHIKPINSIYLIYIIFPISSYIKMWAGITDTIFCRLNYTWRLLFMVYFEYIFDT